jgi:hypothetical protein
MCSVFDPNLLWFILFGGAVGLMVTVFGGGIGLEFLLCYFNRLPTGCI